jgi:DNA-binding LacI/PurR family transcriptional regulator
VGRERGGGSDLYCGQSVTTSYRWRAPALQTLQEMIDLRLVGWAKPANEVRRRISAIDRLRQHLDLIPRCTANAHRACGSEHLGADVVTVACVPTDLHIAQGAGSKTHVDHRVVDVAHLAQCFALQEVAFCRDAFDFAGHQPARQVEIVDTHIDHQTAAVRRIGVVERRATGIATDGFKGQWPSNGATGNNRSGALIRGIESAHEAHLQEDAGAIDRVQHAPGLLDGQRQRFFAKDVLTSLHGGDDDLSVGTGWSGHDHRVEIGLREDGLRLGHGAPRIELLLDLLSGLGIRIGHGDEVDGGGAGGQGLGIKATHPSQADDGEAHGSTHPSTAVAARGNVPRERSQRTFPRVHMSATLDETSPPVKPAQRGAARPAPGRAPTIIDVAAQAGVSKSVVSRVLRDDPTVGPARRDAVLAAAELLRYRPNAVARSLVQRRTFNVGVIVSDLHNLFFAEILDGIGAAAAEAGYQVLITSPGLLRSNEERALEALLQLRTDGIILAGSQLPAAALRAASRTVPLALVTSSMSPPGIDTVATDDFRGGALAVEHLAKLGHRRIAMVDGGDGPGSAERRNGYAAAMHHLGLGPAIRIAEGDFTEDGGWRGTRCLLDDNPRPTAICCANDMAAIGALNAVAEAGLEVPRDMSVVGYDNTALAALRHVALTTIHQPRLQIGEMAMTAVLRRLQRPGARARRELLEPHLVVRQTSAPPPRLT